MDQHLFHISDLMDGALQAMRNRAARAAFAEPSAPVRPRSAPAGPDAVAVPHQKGQPIHYAPERS